MSIVFRKICKRNILSFWWNLAPFFAPHIFCNQENMHFYWKAYCPYLEIKELYHLAHSHFDQNVSHNARHTQYNKRLNNHNATTENKIKFNNFHLHVGGFNNSYCFKGPVISRNSFLQGAETTQNLNIKWTQE